MVTDVPVRICALRSKVRGTQALPGGDHSLSVRETDTPTDLRSTVWWGSGCLVGTSNCPCRKGSAHFRKCVRLEFREQSGEVQSVGSRVDNSRKTSETDVLREKVRHWVEGLWVHAKECRLQLALGTDKALPAWIQQDGATDGMSTPWVWERLDSLG